jgi:ATP adenylyltransferase
MDLVGALAVRQVRPQAQGLRLLLEVDDAALDGVPIDRLVTRQLWAPWRLEYIRQADEQEGCIFCLAAAGDDETGFVIARGKHAFALLNAFPYASGHLMVAPYRHVGAFEELADEEALEVHRLAGRGMASLAGTFAPQGYNLGWNLGRIAGAGITDHIHLHVVPRWAGDTNFMPVLADVKVLPEHLAETRAKLAAAWPR